MKIVVSMTSWVKRIHCVKQFIETFLNTQIDKPDIFYLWLAEEEFPNKEKDLPKDLLACINQYNITLKWTEKNEYCHKRWRVYPLHYNDLVISVDDDVIYSPFLIKSCKYHADINPDKIFLHVFAWSAIPVYNNTIHYQQWLYPRSSADFNLSFFCGQCCFPPKTFPLKACEDIDKRDEICPVCDEAWIIANLLYENKYNLILDPTLAPPRVINNTQDIGIVNTYNKEISNDGINTKKDIGIYNALKYRGVLHKWRELHSDYGEI